MIIIFSKCNLYTLALFAFTRFYLRVLADGNGIILRPLRLVYSSQVIFTNSLQKLSPADPGIRESQQSSNLASLGMGDGGKS